MNCTSQGSSVAMMRSQAVIHTHSLTRSLGVGWYVGEIPRQRILASRSHPFGHIHRVLVQRHQYRLHRLLAGAVGCEFCFGSSSGVFIATMMAMMTLASRR